MNNNNNNNNKRKGENEIFALPPKKRALGKPQIMLYYFAFLSILVYICLVKFVCALMSIQAGQELGGVDSSRGSMRDPNYWLTQEDIALAARDVYGLHNGANSRVITPSLLHSLLKIYV